MRWKGLILISFPRFCVGTQPRRFASITTGLHNQTCVPTETVGTSPRVHSIFGKTT